jgi:DnaJ family protein B protein 4
MVKERKLYDLLGVPPDVNDNDIKKAYKKQALKYHPDKPNGDTEKFKEISEAFDILSNADKRKLYDAYGLEAARRGGVMPDMGAAGAQAGGFPGGVPGGFPGGQGTPFSFSSGGPGGASSFTFSTSGGPGGGYTPFSADDAFNIFRHFGESGGFDGDDIFSSLLGGQKSRRSGGPSFAQSQESAQFSYGDPFGQGAQFAQGGQFGHGGSGGVPAAHEKPEPFTINLPLSLEDLAKGTTKKMKIKRKRQGEPTERILTIHVKPGWKAGTKVKFDNEGDVLPDGTTQDVVFIIQEKPHPKFKRNGNDLEYTLTLSLKEALCGFSRIIETLDGKKLKIENRLPINPGHVLTYPQRGMPISKTPGKSGDLIIKIDVSFPSQLTEDQRKAVETYF